MQRPTETRLRLAFAVVLTGAAGCGGSAVSVLPGGGGGGPTPEFTSACGPLGSQSLLAGLHAAPELDGAVNRSEIAFVRTNNPGQAGGVVENGAGEAGDGWKGTDGESIGKLCAKSSKPAACLEKVQGYRVLPPAREACAAQYPASSYTGMECAASYILYTRGDEIGVARTLAETKALIGTVDTLPEALWFATNAGYERTCGEFDTAYRTTQDGGYDLSNLRSGKCGEDTFRVTVHIDPAGNLSEVSRENLNMKEPCPVAGRRPAGLRLGDLLARRENTVGEHFAVMATLEAASVVAFRRLHRQLRAAGAPRELLDRIRKAARDEVRHARATAGLAKKYGVTPSAPRLGASDPEPSLFAIALENAREGCVRETYGALVAHLQRMRAGDADVRDCMAAIADEETEHAALSWDIAAWIEAQLGDDDREKLAAERRCAFATLAGELAEPVCARVQQATGTPAPGEALRMLEDLEQVLLAA